MHTKVGGAESFVVFSVAVHFGFWVTWGPERVCGPAETVLAFSGVALFSGEMLVRAKLAGDPADVSSFFFFFFYPGSASSFCSPRANR